MHAHIFEYIGHSPGIDWLSFAAPTVFLFLLKEEETQERET